MGFIDPNAPDEIPTPAQQAKEREEAAENADDDEEEEIDTGPDPEEVRERMLALDCLLYTSPSPRDS